MKPEVRSTESPAHDTAPRRLEALLETLATRGVAQAALIAASPSELTILGLLLVHQADGDVVREARNVVRSKLVMGRSRFAPRFRVAVR
jgi:hypothetical protein